MHKKLIQAGYLILVALTLLACGGSKAEVSSSVASHSVSSEVISSGSETEVSYPYISYTSANAVISRLDAKDDFYLYLYQTTCSHCAVASPLINAYIEQRGSEFKSSDMMAVNLVDPNNNGDAADRQVAIYLLSWLVNPGVVASGYASWYNIDDQGTYTLYTPAIIYFKAGVASAALVGLDINAEKLAAFIE